MREGRNWGPERRFVVEARRSKNIFDITILNMSRLWRVGNFRRSRISASSVGAPQNVNDLRVGEDRERKDKRVIISASFSAEAESVSREGAVI